MVVKLEWRPRERSPDKSTAGAITPRRISSARLVRHDSTIAVRYHRNPNVTGRYSVSFGALSPMKIRIYFASAKNFPCQLLPNATPAANVHSRLIDGIARQHLVRGHRDRGESEERIEA